MKRCSKCKQTKPTSEFGRYKKTKDGLFPQCRQCVRENNKRYYANNKEKVKLNVKQWQRQNKEWKRENARKNRYKLKLEIIKAYGGRCTCCDEDRVEFLTLEHKNGDGAKHKRQLEKKYGYKIRHDTIWKEVKAAGYPDDYTILCMNCNFSMGAFGYCPHRSQK